MRRPSRLPSLRRWRFREAGLWLLDPPEYFDPPDRAAARYLSFSPPEPPRALAPLVNASAPEGKNDKYKAGWLVPDGLNLSPRLRQHLELVRRHILAMRDALALAHSLGRTLVLPRLPCVCDRSEAPSILARCVYEGSDLEAPFICPLTHIFDIVRLLQIRPRAAAGSGYDGGRASLDFRESSFLDNPAACSQSGRINPTKIIGLRIEHE